VSAAILSSVLICPACGFALVGRHADRGVLIRFGLPAILASFIGAWTLVRLAGAGPLFQYTFLGRDVQVMPIGFAIGLLLLLFSLVELIPRLNTLSFPPRYQRLGGFLTGCSAACQACTGALRSAFLTRAGLTKEASATSI